MLHVVASRATVREEKSARRTDGDRADLGLQFVRGGEVIKSRGRREESKSCTDEGSPHGPDAIRLPPIPNKALITT